MSGLGAVGGWEGAVGEEMGAVGAWEGAVGEEKGAVGDGIRTHSLCAIRCDVGVDVVAGFRYWAPRVRKYLTMLSEQGGSCLATTAGSRCQQRR